MLWTSEAVSSGHPDKIADQIADSILDEHLKKDPFARVACEVVVTSGLVEEVVPSLIPLIKKSVIREGTIVFLTGEITSTATIDFEFAVNYALLMAGYNRALSIENKIRKQSVEIANAVTRDGGEIGAGDQGVMFGYACDETEDFMPLTHSTAFKIIRALEEDRLEKEDNADCVLRPDSKAQVTICYRDGKPELHTILVSTQHKSNLTLEEVRKYVMDIINGLGLKTENTNFLINPAGLWTVGGPEADSGLSGRKIVVDNFGSDCPVGGGSFSGKDPTKVDRSGAYAARHIAKNIVAAGLARKAQVQIAYAIGVVEPVSIDVKIFDTNPLCVLQDEDVTRMVRELVPLSPKAIIDRFDLRRPIYYQTAAFGHFGGDYRPWEKLDLVETFQKWYRGR